MRQRNGAANLPHPSTFFLHPCCSLRSTSTTNKLRWPWLFTVHSIFFSFALVGTRQFLPCHLRRRLLSLSVSMLWYWSKKKVVQRMNGCSTNDQRLCCFIFSRFINVSKWRQRTQSVKLGSLGLIWLCSIDWLTHGWDAQLSVRGMRWDGDPQMNTFHLLQFRNEDFFITCSYFEAVHQKLLLFDKCTSAVHIFGDTFTMMRGREG